jgi:EmrB/QacA subfamily drug resistance transporter
VCFAQFMVVLDATIVNVALPSIQRDLDLSNQNLQWVVNAYTLVFGGFLLLGGRAADLLGRRRLFVAGLAIFSLASLVNALASSGEMLIVARAFQGLGGALVSPAALSIITTTFKEGPDRTKALSVWGGIAAGGAAFGLLLGGVLTQTLSWQWNFIVNVPVGIAVLVAALRLVPESRQEGALRHFDVAGATTVTGGLMLAVYTIVKAQTWGWGSTTTLAFAAASLAVLASFVAIELRSPQPLVRLSFFRTRSIATANGAMFLVAGGMFGMFYFASLYVQEILGYGPLRAGLAFLPVSAGIMVGAVLSQQLIARIGVKVVVVTGMSLGVAPADAGLASGTFNTSQQVGGALGLAVLATLASNRTTSSLADVAGVPNTLAQHQALVDGFQVAFIAAAVLMALGLVTVSAFLRRRDVAEVDAGDIVAVPA